MSTPRNHLFKNITVGLAFFCLLYVSTTSPASVVRSYLVAPASPQTTRKVNETSSTATSTSSLFSRIAPLFFPIDPETNQIALPSTVTTIMIDVGARDSDYMAVLEKRQDPTVALLMVDPLPDSYVPLQSRVAAYSMRDMDGRFLKTNSTNRAFLLPAALGESEGTVDFNIAPGPACGSILPVHDKNTFWCAKSIGQRKVMLFKLKDILDMLPTHNPQGIPIQVHIKIDAEGADLMVLKGAGAATFRERPISTVIIECMTDSGNETEAQEHFRTGDCVNREAIQWMCQQAGFCKAHIDNGNRLSNIFWAHPGLIPDSPEFQEDERIYGQLGHKVEQTLRQPMPEYLNDKRLTWKNFYGPVFDKHRLAMAKQQER